MTALGKLIRKSRRAQEMTMAALAESAQALPGAPDVTETAIRYLETSRRMYNFDDPDDPLSWVVQALRIPDGEVFRAMGLARRKEGA